MRRLLSVAGAMTCLLGFGLLTSAEAGAQQNAINQTPNQDYVAMGDSYSAGNGAGSGNYYETTCYRSNFAYGPLISNAINPGAGQIPGTFAHPACSGARTNHIDQDTQQDYPRQINLLGNNTDFVTLTIGGNDAGFTDALQNCAIPFGGCTDSGGSLDQAQAYIQNTLPALLDRNYASIRSKAPNAVVTVLGYPRIFKASGTCNLVFSDAEVKKANATADLLNDVMRQRVQAAGPGFAYVDSRAAWIGHGACDSVEWINGFSASDTVGSFHPNQTGYIAYAGMARATLLAQRRVGQTIGPSGHIAFTSTRDGNSEIYVANADGSFPVNVTNDAGNDVDPVWSPDGNKLAFASSRDGDNEIYVVNADGTGLTKLTNNAFDDREPDWSPNGDYLIFRTNRTGNDEIFKMTAAGGLATNLTNNSLADQAPDWSPDGSEITWQRLISGTNTDVFRMNSDGQGQFNLTSNAAVDSQPAWSPDGNTIAFQTSRDGNLEIYTVARISPPATPAVTPPTPIRRTNNGAADREPSFSPDGSRLTFTSSRDGNDEIYTATVSGTTTYPAQTRITNDGGADALPTWQGDKTAPDTSIDSGPNGQTNQTTPTFTFGSTEPGSSFECRVDGGSFVSCPTPFTTGTLGEGSHTIEARATDRSGNTDATPASRTFNVDVTPATTTITSGPDNGAVTDDTTPDFEFASDDPQSTFECSVDDGTFGPCSSPFTTQTLGDGDHTFTVRGTDSAGNPDAQPDTANFTVDATAPETTIDFSPVSPTKDPRPSLTFSSSESGSTFECRIDNGTWELCSSPQEYPGDLSDGSHTFEVRATDAAGNTDQSPDSATFEVDTAAPNTTITSSAPPASDNTPTFEFDSTETNSTFECRIDTGTFASCSSPFTSPQLGDGPHTFEVRATDAAGNLDPTPASLNFTTDATAPSTSIDAGPGRTTPNERTGSATPTWAFSSDDPTATYECQVDSTPYVPCDQTFTPASALSDGSHTFRVRASDPSGNVDQTPAAATFTVDTTAPDTSITAGPAEGANINDTTPTFEFTSPDNSASFECRVDSNPFANCSSPQTTAALNEGQHTFEVRAVDPVSNRDSSPASRTFTVDTTAPETSISVGPAAGSQTADSTPTFEFTSPDNSASFECRVDSAAFANCSSPFTTGALSDGSHTFEVRAVDQAANADQSPASRNFTVDTGPPTTTIVGAPLALGNDASPTFTFAADESGATFECKVDSGTFASCNSPHQVGPLSDGSHTFQVRATDVAGNIETSPESRTFTVDTAAPDTSVDSGPQGPTRDRDAAFTFSSPDNGASFECRLDGGAFSSCSGPTAFTNLPDGDHVFEVRAIDAAGNSDATPASRAFSVDNAVKDAVVTAAKKQKAKRTRIRVAIRASAGERVELEASGKLKAGRKAVNLAVTEATVEPGSQSTILIAPAGGKAARVAKKRIAAGKKIKARIAVKVTDALGNEQSFNLRVKLK